MRSALLITLGWFGITAGLYGALVALEVYWNLFNWRFKLDGEALGLLFAVFLCLVAIRFMTCFGRHRVTQAVSLLLCVALVSLAAYVLPPEPLSQGLFAREAPSPLWYRGGRFVVMALPLAFWTRRLLGKREQQC